MHTIGRGNNNGVGAASQRGQESKDPLAIISQTGSVHLASEPNAHKLFGSTGQSPDTQNKWCLWGLFKRTNMQMFLKKQIEEEQQCGSTLCRTMCEPSVSKISCAWQASVTRRQSPSTTRACAGMAIIVVV
jgi:hypothetical protein